ncbi:MAG TPA: hypothetical protein VGF34_15310 [Stellaceae bacterium]|jgi:hypothetical protein
MKLNSLLSGAAIAAGLVIAVPVWAQGPPPTGRHYGGFSGDSPNPGFGPMSTEAGVAPPAAAPPIAPPAPRHHPRRHARAHARTAPLDGASASQLNQQELARIQGGAPPAPMSGPPPQQ